MSVTFLLAVAGFSAAVLIIAAFLLLRVSDADGLVGARFDAARGTWPTPRDADRVKSGPSVAVLAQQALLQVGRAVMQSGLVRGRTRTGLQQTLSVAGFRGPNALPLFVGGKLVLLFGLPLLAWLVVDPHTTNGLLIMVAVGVVGLVLPDNVISRRRQAQLKKIEAGLSDALDLMVICAQAGLSLEPAMARVAAELRNVHPAMCDELAITVRELEIMSDSSQALTNLGKRTGLESLMRLTSTLIQTMQYGTPLSDSLRTLSNEMRTASLTRFEERAARLPVLLTLPMIVFILPTVFMVVGGPAGIQIIKALS